MKWKYFDSSWMRKIGFSQAIIPSVLPDKDHISKQLIRYVVSFISKPPEKEEADKNEKEKEPEENQHLVHDLYFPNNK